MLIKLAIIITCYNRRDSTLECLKALYRSYNQMEECSINIYLVDDGSTDGTKEAIASQFPKVNILQGSGNLYWGGGMVKAWKEAALYGYDFYLWLNDDTYLMPTALTTLFADSYRFSHKAIIAGACEWLLTQQISYSGYTLKTKKVIVPTGKPTLCDFFNGNVVLIPNYVFNNVGFLDEQFHHHLGDIDYGLRAKILDINSYVSSSAVAKCNGHSKLSPWCNPELSLKQRIKFFKSPLTKKPKQVFSFEKRHTSLTMAVFRSGIIYVRLLFPFIWIWMGKHKLGEG